MVYCVSFQAIASSYNYHTDLWARGNLAADARIAKLVESRYAIFKSEGLQRPEMIALATRFYENWIS
jgi:hypothetical protein